MTKERLSHVEELELVKRVQGLSGGRAKASREYCQRVSMDRLVRHNTGLVHKVVSKFPLKNATCSYEDLYQEGVLGFMHGVRKFDTTRGYRLSTYVFNWISAYVRRYYLNHYRTVRLPVHITARHTQLNKQIERLTVELGRTPTLDEVCEIDENADSLICNSLHNVSLNALTGEDSELMDLMGEDKTHEHECELDVFFMLNKLRENVSPRDYKILVQRYGLDGDGERTLQELADANDITRARCHQIENNLLRKLKAQCASS